jgi:CubicO group peptidase (beta-lactamase class C family)
MIKVLLLLGTLASMFTVPWILVKAWILPLPNTVEEQLSEALSHGFDGMIVYVDKAGQEAKFYTAGWHNKEKKIPTKADAYFKIASISKLYKAVAVVKLVHEKRLFLDTSLANYFPELIGKLPYTDKITLRMLLQHRSGIPDYTYSPVHWETVPNTQQESLEIALAMPTEFEPNSSYSYSNTNYLLISMLLKKTLGYSDSIYVQEEIFKPLGLKKTFHSFSEINIDDLMSGYYGEDKENVTMEDYGSMIATAEDVGIFLRALNDGSLLSEAEQKIYSSVYEYEHGGLLPGYQSFAKYHKDIDAVIVQFVNTSNFEGYDWNLSQIIYNRVADIVKNEAKRD